MRDPARIREMLDLIERIWEKDSDLRFMQLIYNLQSGYSFNNSDLGKIQEIENDGFSRIGFDLFNIEDESILEYLKEYEKSMEDKK